MKGTNRIEAAGLAGLFLLACFGLAFASLSQVDQSESVAGGSFVVLAEHGVGDGRLASEVPVGRVSDLAAGLEGDIYFVDAENHRVRRIDRDGVVTTLLNAYEKGLDRDGIMGPSSVAVDPTGVVYVGDATTNPKTSACG